eukprot:862972-Pyramimonas_sp.AAC.1
MVSCGYVTGNVLAQTSAYCIVLMPPHKETAPALLIDPGWCDKFDADSCGDDSPKIWEVRSTNCFIRKVGDIVYVLECRPIGSGALKGLNRVRGVARWGGTHGPFTNLDDFDKEYNKHKVDRPTIERMVAKWRRDSKSGRLVHP